MSRKIPNILKRRQKSKDVATAKPVNTSLEIGGNVKLIFLQLISDKVTYDKEQVLNEDVHNVFSDDSDIEVVSSLIQPKKITKKFTKSKLKRSTLVVKRSKNESINNFKNTVSVTKQHKSLPILNNYGSSEDKNVDDNTGLLIENLLDLRDNFLSDDDDDFQNNENNLLDCFQSDQSNKDSKYRNGISEITSKKTIESVAKQFKHKSKIPKHSETLDTLNNVNDSNSPILTDEEIGISFENLLELADDERFPDINKDLSNDKNADLVPQRDKGEFKVKSVEQYKKSVLTSESKANNEAEAVGSSVNGKDYKQDDLSLESNNISNLDGNDKSLMDSLPPKDDPSIFNNTPLNVNSIGDTLLTTDDTETLNSLVRLKCYNCLDLVQCPTVEPQMECQKCRLKYHYQCKICTSGFYSLYSLYTHLVKFHSRGDSVHTLTIKPQYVEPFKLKKLRYDPNDLFICQKCNSTFPLKNVKDRHEAICSRNPRIKCPFCPLAMGQKKTLKYHMIKFHSQSFDVKEVNTIINNIVKDGKEKTRKKKVVKLLETLQIAYCPKCENRSQVHELVDGEMICPTCSEKLVFVCTESECSRTFPTTKSLNTHVRLIHVEKPEHYRCTNCQYTTTNNKDLLKHQKGCGGVAILPARLFFCPHCDKSFKKERYLQLHLNRPEACAGSQKQELECPKCQRKFRMRHWLKNHRCDPEAKPPETSKEQLPIELVPLQEPEYPCPDCGKVFKQMRWFNVHKEKYCGKHRVLYRCAHCRYHGYDKKKLKVHMRCVHVHLCTGKKLRCSKCGTKWTSIYSLNRHMDNCTGNYEFERVKMSRKKQKVYFEYI